MRRADLDRTKGDADTTPAPVIPAEPGVSVAPELEDKVTIEETNMEDEETEVDISEGYEALSRYVREEGIRTAGPVYACDLAGFILNGVERNAVSMISVGLAEKEGA